MNGIFAKIYFDEDVNVLVAELIRQHNFQTLTTTEADRKGESDLSQLEYSAKNGYVILTHNRIDFEELAKSYFAENKTHFGIIIAVRRPPQIIAERLLKILDIFSADEFINQTIYI
ncbi:MAG: DUF5615 family PIN-like protein [Aridibacter sp.]